MECVPASSSYRETGDASIDNARHRLAGLGCASRLGSLFDAASLCDQQDTVRHRRKAQRRKPSFQGWASSRSPSSPSFARCSHHSIACVQRVRDYSANGQEQLRTWRPFGERAHRRCRRPSNCAWYLRSPKKLIACNDSLPLRIVTCRRDHLLLNYFLRCPLSGFSGWTIHTSERMIGFAVLKITPHGRIQLGKIVDCWLDTEDPSCWQAAVAALDRSPPRPFRGHCHMLCYHPEPARGIALEWLRQIGGKKRVRSRQTAICCPEAFFSDSRCLMPMVPFSRR